MLIKGCARGDPSGLARHVEKTENESVRLIRSDGVLAEDIRGTIAEMDALGAAQRCARTARSITPRSIRNRAKTGR
jgi:hypothetical protein